MRYVIDQVKDDEQDKVLAVIRMEIDYELLSLHDALVTANESEIMITKERLINLVEQLKYITQYN